MRRSSRSLTTPPGSRNTIVGIVIGSTIKGLLAGAIIGLFARKVSSLPWTLAFGTFIGALLAFGIKKADVKTMLVDNPAKLMWLD